MTWRFLPKRLRQEAYQALPEKNQRDECAPPVGNHHEDIQEIVFQTSNENPINQESSLEWDFQTGDDYLDDLLRQALNSKFFLDDDNDDDDHDEDLLQGDRISTSASEDGSDTISCSTSCRSLEEDEDSQCEWRDVSKDPFLWLASTQHSSSSKSLSELLWNRDWEHVPDRIIVHPEEVSQATFLPNMPHMKALPLHLACTMRPLPPVEIVQFLLSVYPEAASHREESTCGLLPLHFAVNMGREHLDVSSSFVLFPSDAEDDDSTFNDHRAPLKTPAVVDTLPEEQICDEIDDGRQQKIIESLLAVYPQALTVRDAFHGMMPLHIAAMTVPCQKEKISPSSYSVMQLLLGKMSRDDTLEPSYSWETAIDMAKRRATNNGSPPSNSNVETNLNWVRNPLLDIPNEDTVDAIKKLLFEDETDATSVTTSLSFSFSSDDSSTENFHEPSQQVVAPEPHPT